MSEKETHGGLDPIGRALSWIQAGRRAALAVVVDTWGSSPCPRGSLLAVNDETAFEGSVSGGCVEGEVVTESLALMENGGFKVLDYGITDDTAWEVGLACGGKLTVFVTAVMEPWRDALTGLAAARQGKRPAALIIDLDDGGAEVFAGEDRPRDAALAEAMTESLETDRSRLAESADGHRRFVGAFNPPLRLLVIGAVHIAQALAPLARRTGFEVVVIDPRGAWATKERFPGVTIDSRWPGEAIEALAPDGRTAVVSLSHDPKLDDQGLAAALATKAFYIGALGSKKTQAKRRQRLAADGVAEESLARIHGPVGLDIGAETPAEIAVAIMADVVAALRKAGD